MPWRYESDDDTIEVIVDPDFQGDVLELARTSVVYIVDTLGNSETIEMCWRVGSDMNLCEVNRCKVTDPNGREGNVMDVLYLAYIHYFYPFLVIRGVEATSSLVKILADEGIAIVGKTADGVIARVPDDLPESPLWGHAHYLKADYLYQKAEDLKNEEEG